MYFFRIRPSWGKIEDGTVFDVPNCELGHHGENVSFDSILKKYNLTEPALLLLGEIVRAVDSHPTNPHPAGEGLRWIAGGFGALGLTTRFFSASLLFTTRFMQNANGGSTNNNTLWWTLANAEGDWHQTLSGAMEQIFSRPPAG